jgi:pyrroloquinoline-quinone synthase
MHSVTPQLSTAATSMESSNLKAHLTDALARAIAGRELLTHPFYQRWQAGEVSLDELSRYAVQYRAFEAALPEILANIVAGIDDASHAAASDLVAQNLQDELETPAPHLALFDRFAAALPDAGDNEIAPATRGLVGTYRDLATDAPVRALAALAAYETQASAIASTKGEGLREWYGISDAATEFWDVHAAMEVDHGDWAIDALMLLEADPAAVEEAGRQGAGLWWSFLDERQSELGELVGCSDTSLTMDTASRTS